MFENFRKNDVAPLVVRFALGLVFILHGGAKVLEGFGTSWMPGENALPGLIQFLVAWGELLCGLSVLLGFWAWLGAAGIIFIMSGAIATVHGRHGFFLPSGFEYNFVLISMSAVLILLGTGPLALDQFVFRKKSG